MGNLASVRRALEDLGAEAYIADHPAALYEANRIVLPGVGAFSQGMKSLVDSGWFDALHDVVDRQHKPLLGICLGMQMLASAGEEGGPTRGLGFIPGKVSRLDTLGCGLRLPQVARRAPRPHPGRFRFLLRSQLCARTRAARVCSRHHGLWLRAGGRRQKSEYFRLPVSSREELEGGT
jgi:hypothetical protein